MEQLTGKPIELYIVVVILAIAAGYGIGFVIVPFFRSKDEENEEDNKDGEDNNNEGE